MRPVAKFIASIKSRRNVSRLLSLFLILLSLISAVNCFDISVTPSSICCGDCITVTISLTNTGDSIFNGHIEIHIIDAAGYQNPMNGLDITLQPHESNDFKTQICPSNCNSYGTYQVVVKVLDNNGNEQGTRTSTFVVKDPASCQGSSGGSKTPGCTWTFTCDNNIVKRLCVDQNGKEYWKEYDNCNNYNLPRSCINGVCVDTTLPGGSNQPQQTCNQQACQSQDKPVGSPYSKNGAQYQRYMECNCVGNTCSCDQTEREVPCTGVISGKVTDAENGNQIAGASISIQGGKASWSGTSDDVGTFSTSQAFCPSTNYGVTCSAKGYTTASQSGVTDSNGNSFIAIALQPESKPKEIKFTGTLYRSNAPMGFAVYYFKVDKILEGENIPIGDPVGVDIYDDTKPLGQGGSADTLQVGDKAEVYASINTDKGEWNDGYETAWPASITEDKKYYIKKLSQEENKPDLTITDVRFSDENLVEGKPAYIIATIKNIGNKECYIDTVDFYYCVAYENPITSPDDEKKVKIAEKNPSKKLEPGDAIDVSAQWIVVPIYNTENKHIHIHVSLDTIFGDVESNENNNDFYKNINVQKSSQGCDFDITKDAYSFKNDKLNANQIELIKGMIPSVYELLDPTVKSKLPMDTLSLLINNLGPNEGICYGMASTSILYYDGLLPKPESKITFDLLQDDSDAMGRIYRYQSKQWILKIINVIETQSDSLSTEFDKIANSIKNLHEPILLALWDNNGEGHAVVVFDYYDVSDNEKNLVVYDPNYPGIAKIIKLNLNTNEFNYENYAIAKAEESTLLK